MSSIASRQSRVATQQEPAVEVSQEDDKESIVVEETTRVTSNSVPFSGFSFEETKPATSPSSAYESVTEVIGQMRQLASYVSPAPSSCSSMDSAASSDLNLQELVKELRESQRYEDEKKEDESSLRSADKPVQPEKNRVPASTEEVWGGTSRTPSPEDMTPRAKNEVLESERMQTSLLEDTSSSSRTSSPTDSTNDSSAEVSAQSNEKHLQQQTPPRNPAGPSRRLDSKKSALIQRHKKSLQRRELSDSSSHSSSERTASSTRSSPDRTASSYLTSPDRTITTSSTWTSRPTPPRREGSSSSSRKSLDQPFPMKLSDSAEANLAVDVTADEDEIAHYFNPSELEEEPETKEQIVSLPPPQRSPRREKVRAQRFSDDPIQRQARTPSPGMRPIVSEAKMPPSRSASPLPPSRSASPRPSAASIDASIDAKQRQAQAKPSGSMRGPSPRPRPFEPTADANALPPRQVSPSKLVRGDNRHRMELDRPSTHGDGEGSSKLATSTPARAMTPIGRMRYVQEHGEEPPMPQPPKIMPPVAQDLLSVFTDTPTSPGSTAMSAKAEETSIAEKKYTRKDRRGSSEDRRDKDRQSLDGKKGRRKERRRKRHSSNVSGASSKGTGTTFDDESTVFTTDRAFSCQESIQAVINSVLHVRCGNLDDSLSMYDESSDEDDDDESSVESDMPEEGVPRKERVVSFDDESQFSEERRKRFLLHKQRQKAALKAQQERLPQIPQSDSSSGEGGKTTTDDEADSDEKETQANTEDAQLPEVAVQPPVMADTTTPKLSNLKRDTQRREAPSPRPATPSDFDAIGIHDRLFIKAFIRAITTNGIPLLFHAKQRKQSFAPGTIVTSYLQHGVETSKRRYSEPCLTWQTDEGVTKGAVELFDIASLDKTTAMELSAYPLAMPGRSVVLRANGGADYVFEAPSEEHALRFVHGMRWVIARLAFNLIIGNVDVSCELLAIDDAESDEDYVPNRAMNDVTNHLVDKSLLYN